MSAEKLPDRPDGVRTMTAKAVAKRLGVGPDLIDGLVIAKKIRGYRAQGKTGKWIVLVDVAEMHRLLAEVTK